eukprot:9192477-Pyramimonas_sp.AAC.1
MQWSSDWIQARMVPKLIIEQLGFPMGSLRTKCPVGVLYHGSPIESYTVGFHRYAYTRSFRWEFDALDF